MDTTKGREVRMPQQSTNTDLSDEGDQEEFDWREFLPVDDGGAKLAEVLVPALQRKMSDSQ